MSDKRFEVKILKRYCKGCGLCVEVCKEDKIYIDPHPTKDGRQTAALRDDIRCSGCLKCATICPDAAIEVYKLQEVASGEDAGED